LGPLGLDALSFVGVLVTPQGLAAREAALAESALEVAPPYWKKRRREEDGRVSAYVPAFVTIFFNQEINPVSFPGSLEG
jgi:hypothetical protein